MDTDVTRITAAELGHGYYERAQVASGSIGPICGVVVGSKGRTLAVKVVSAPDAGTLDQACRQAYTLRKEIAT